MSNLRNNNCSVAIQSVDLTEEGEWKCELEANRQKAETYFKLEVFKPAKVELKGAAELIVDPQNGSIVFVFRNGPPFGGQIRVVLGQHPAGRRNRNLHRKAKHSGANHQS